MKANRASNQDRDGVDQMKSPMPDNNDDTKKTYYVGYRNKSSKFYQRELNVKAIDDENLIPELHKRVMVYPKIHYQISLDVPVSYTHLTLPTIYSV